MEKIKTFFADHKTVIKAVVVGLVAAVGALGYAVPQPVIDLFNSLIGG